MLTIKSLYKKQIASTFASSQINNKTIALKHWFNHGKNENRLYNVAI